MELKGKVSDKTGDTLLVSAWKKVKLKFERDQTRRSNFVRKHMRKKINQSKRENENTVTRKEEATLQVNQKSSIRSTQHLMR